MSTSPYECLVTGNVCRICIRTKTSEIGERVTTFFTSLNTILKNYCTNYNKNRMWLKNPWNSDFIYWQNFPHFRLNRSIWTLTGLDIYGGFPKPEKSIASTTAYPFSVKVCRNTSYLIQHNEGRRVSRYHKLYLAN